MNFWTFADRNVAGLGVLLALAILLAPLVVVAARTPMGSCVCADGGAPPP